MSLIGNCLDKLVKAGRIDKKTADAAKDLYEKIRAGAETSAGETAASAYAALKAAEAMGAAAVEKKYQAAMNGLALDRAAERVRADPHSRAVGALRLFAPIDAVGGKVGDKNVQSLTQAIEGFISKPFATAMEKYGSKLAGLTKDLDGPRNLVRELFGINTGDEFAKVAADGWTAANERAVSRAKAAGKVFQTLEDWRIPQFWSTSRARSFGREEFAADIMTAVDDGALIVRDIDAGGAAAGRDRAAEIVDASSRKIWLGTGESAGYGAPGSFSPEMRIFKFADGEKGAEAWLRLQGKYGVGQDIMQALQSHIHHQARDIALSDVLGPSHRANFQSLLEIVREEKAEEAIRGPGIIARAKALTLSDLSKKAAARGLSNLQLKMFSSETALDRIYRTATGEADAVAGTFWAGVFGSLRHTHVASNMGSAIVSSIAPDSWTAVLAARSNNIEPVKLLSRIVGEFTTGGAESRELVAQMGIVAHGAIDAALNASRYADEGSVANAMARVSNVVIRAQGLHAWDDALKRAFTMEFMGMVGRQKETAFADLDPIFREFMERYGFTADEWDLIRTGGKHVEMDGARFFDPDSIERMDLQERFKSAFLDERRYATPEAGLLEKSVAGDMRRGTFWGEMGRSMLLYKSFPMWLMLTHLQRGAVLAAEGRGGYMAQLVAGLTIAGMVVVQAKDLLTGKDPRPMNRWETWLAAAAQGGGGGIYGDFLRSAVDRRQGSLTEALLGPAVGLAADTAKLVSSNIRQGVEGAPTRWQGELVNFLRRYTPGSNLWYSRLATDRLVWDQVQKMADPEWGQSFSRVRDKALKDWDQRFWWDKGETTPDRAPDFGAALGR